MLARGALLALAAGALYVSQLGPQQARESSLPYPEDWRGDWWSSHAVEECEPRAGSERPGLGMSPDAPDATLGYGFWLERFTWMDLELICPSGASAATDPGEEPAELLLRIAAFLDMKTHGADVRVERVGLDDREALMLVAPRYDGWNAVVVAPAEDVAILYLYAPTESELLRSWQRWAAMTRGTPP